MRIYQSMMTAAFISIGAVSQGEFAHAVADANDPKRFMQLAIKQAKKKPKYPFGAVLVRERDGKILASGFNHREQDPTLHAEMVVIHAAAKIRPKIDWSQTALYTTAEPCAMCQSAIGWAKIGDVYYGTSIPFISNLGLPQIDIRAEEILKHIPFAKTQIHGGLLEEDTNTLFLAAKKLW